MQLRARADSDCSTLIPATLKLTQRREEVIHEEMPLVLRGDGEVDITEFDITECDVTFFQETDITESDVSKKGN